MDAHMNEPSVPGTFAPYPQKTNEEEITDEVVMKTLPQSSESTKPIVAEDSPDLETEI